MPFVISWDKMNKMSISRKQGNFPETKTTKLSMFPSWNVNAYQRRSNNVFDTAWTVFAACGVSDASKNLQEVTGRTLHLRETFENLFHIVPLRRTRSGILQFKFEPWYSFYTADQDTARYSLLGKIMSVEQNLSNVQQTIYSVRAYSCWICSPFMRYVYSKI